MTVLSWSMIFITLATLAFLAWAVYRGIMRERRPGQRVWPQFGLGLILGTLFVGTWISHGLAQWEVFQQDQRMHGEPVVVGEFVNEFGQSTLENWQSEFLQLFTMVVLSALLLYRGSSQSRDSQDRIEEKLDMLLAGVGVPGVNGPPSKSANKPVWVDFAVAQGVPREHAESMTKEDLVERYGS